MENVTIKEIAEHAGVSMKTVSRVLNDEPNVKPLTRDKVREAAKALNYRPNFSARRLASRKSFIIAHFHDNPNPDYLEKLHQGIHQACRTARYFSVMEPLPYPYAMAAADYLGQFKIDGVILSPPLCDDIELLDVLTQANIPFVRISPRTERHLSSSSYIDDKRAVCRMTHRLIDMGHEKIAFIAGPDEHKVSFLRQDGFMKALKEADINLENCPIVQGGFTVRSGTEICQKLIKNNPNITAIFAANDDMAVGAIMGANKAGLKVPEDLSVIGFDGSRIGDVIWPALTTICQPAKAMALAAAELLLAEISDPELEKRNVEFDVDLLMRGTTITRSDNVLNN